LATLALATIGCSGGGSGKEVPNPLGPGEIINVTLCGSTTEPRNPCTNFPDNSIEIRVNPADGSQQCPCFNFAFLNQNLNDLGAPNSNYEFTGFRPGTYTVTGQFNTRGVGFTFAHNTSTSAIGIVPSSLQSLSGPAVGGQSCRVEYNTGSSLNRTPVDFSFQFTVAAATAGGSCYRFGADCSEATTFAPSG
jgi:hypothetical protein